MMVGILLFLVTGLILLPFRVQELMVVKVPLEEPKALLMRVTPKVYPLSKRPIVGSEATKLVFYDLYCDDLSFVFTFCSGVLGLVYYSLLVF